MDANELLQLACHAARLAGEAILDIYGETDFQIVEKADSSPLTAADLAAHGLIKETLAPSGLPLLSEEGRQLDYETRRDWPRFWLVDPLDGTKEFIKRNGEFTVNIALVEAQTPILGVVYVPVTDVLYAGLAGVGAFKESQGVREPIQALEARLSDPGLKVVASRSHRDAQTEAFLAGLAQPEVVSMGSSLKFMLLAEGAAQVYPRFAPTMEWDTAAAEAILTAAGGSILKMPEAVPMVYNKPDLLNPFFLARSWQDGDQG